MTRIVLGVLAVLAWLAIAVEQAPLQARQAGGRVYGAVTDVCGGPLPAEVRLTAADGAVVVAYSNEEPAAGQLPVPFDDMGWFFLVRNLTPGTYTVTAVLAGFRPVATPQVTIGSGDTVRTDLVLELAGLNSHQSYFHVLVEPEDAVRYAHAVVRLRLMEVGQSRLTQGVNTTKRRAMVLEVIKRPVQRDVKPPRRQPPIESTRRGAVLTVLENDRDAVTLAAALSQRGVVAPVEEYFATLHDTCLGSWTISQLFPVVRGRVVIAGAGADPWQRYDRTRTASFARVLRDLARRPPR